MKKIINDWKDLVGCDDLENSKEFQDFSDNILPLLYKDIQNFEQYSSEDIHRALLHGDAQILIEFESERMTIQQSTMVDEDELLERLRIFNETGLLNVG